MRNIAFISLSALKNNAEEIKKRLKKTTRFCAVVKADAYGHGAEKCANALYPVVDAFAVAIVEEGIRLRLSGIDKDILVLVPPQPSDIVTAIKNGLSLTVESLDDIRSIGAAANILGLPVKIHVKYDTGMKRFGANSVDEVKRILDYADGNGKIKISGFYTHLFDPTDMRARESQIKKFLLANKVVNEYNRNVISHVSASAGFLYGEEFDMVRIGILLYGYKPFPTDTISVKPVMKVYAPIIKERRLNKGESALYGQRVADRNENLSLVRFGYADGLDRCENAEIFNNRCMDVSLYRAERNGKFFCIMKNADELASKSGTISYEILTKITARADRVYLT